MDSFVSAIAEVLCTKTGRMFLRLFGIRQAPEALAFLLGLMLWIVIGIIIAVLIYRN
jgi:hypothetical protein